MICFLLGALAQGILPFQWGWIYSLWFGAILSSTDPVSVVDLLKRTKASSKLTTVIAGESLLNDGSAIILFFFS
jgi:NhaP-type Na+/H+ or K+/H+ antiporter